MVAVISVGVERSLPATPSRRARDRFCRRVGIPLRQRVAARRQLEDATVLGVGDVCVFAFERDVVAETAARQRIGFLGAAGLEARRFSGWPLVAIVVAHPQRIGGEFASTPSTIYRRLFVGGPQARPPALGATR